MTAALPKTRITYASPEDPVLRQWIIRAIEVASGRRHIERMYWDLLDEVDAGREGFFTGALARLQLELRYDSAQFDKIPDQGPLIIVANHPYGVLDGLVICYLAHQARGPFKVLTNAVLCQEPRLQDHLLPIDFDETRAAMRTNIHTKKMALETLADGGTVVIFPSGGVATAEGLFGEVQELEWKPFASRLVQQAQATVVPVYFPGANGFSFQLVSQMSMTLRLSLLIRELSSRIGTPFFVEIGDPIPYHQLAGIKDRKVLTEHLRGEVMKLAASPG